MNKILICLLMLQGSIDHCLGQAHVGARLKAMGNNGNAIKDTWSLQGNPSGIAGLNSAILAIDYTKYLFASELSRQAIAFAFPLKGKLALGLAFDRYGMTAYSEIKAGAAIVRKFGKLAIGLKGNYHQLRISDYGTTTALSVDAGACYSLNEQILLGICLSNPAQQQYRTQALNLAIPTTFQLGISYTLSDKVLLASNLSKTLKAPIDVALGLDYQLLTLLSLRGGLSASPFRQYAGFGLSYKKLMLDMAVESDPNLGYSPQITLGYVF